MPVQHSPPSRHTKSQARAQAVLTPTPRACLNGTPAVPQLRAQLDRRPHITILQVLVKMMEEDNSLEEEDSDGTEVIPSPVGESQGTGGPTLSQSNQPVSQQSEPSLFYIMQQMTHIMANLQADSSYKDSRSPAFKTPSMKASECFYSIQPFKVRSFIQSF
ncbi:hypothetical protein O181_040064 [Austropuccinia psidii MF-1]|uniref:Uncharacterized protein n=1 Tax=Austropuccinia psidii MF-1 TaxID=1389203 RepID=A0A9Q3HF51_9BASI|nr:hypothetical protein [Austropuccinia psidii MF-1]